MKRDEKSVSKYKAVNKPADKYYEMFRGKNSVNKKDLSNSPDSPEHSDQDSDADG